MINLENPKILAIAVAISVLLLAGIVWMIRLVIGLRKDLPDQSANICSEHKSTSLQDFADASQETSCQDKPLGDFSKIITQAGVDGGEDSELMEIIADIDTRIREAGPFFGKETPDNFIAELVDRYDDLGLMLKNHQDNSAEVISSARNELSSILKICGVDLIHSNHWDSSIQRAIVKEPCSGIDLPIIIRFGSSGIRRHGELIRKQEVVIAVPAIDLNHQ